MCKVISKYKLYLILNNERNFHEKKLLKYKKFILFAIIPPPLYEQKKKQFKEKNYRELKWISVNNR